MMFRSYSNISKYFLRDYGTIAMVIILVTLDDGDLFTCEDIYVIYRAGGPYGEKLCPRS